MTHEENTTEVDVWRQLHEDVDAILDYADGLREDRFHGCWEDWPCLMDEATDRIRRINDCIGQLEDASKLRMLRAAGYD